MAKKTFRFQKVDFLHGASTGPPCDFDGIREPVADRLILAAEHTVFDYAGTTHGGTYDRCAGSGVDNRRGRLRGSAVLAAYQAAL